MKTPLVVGLVAALAIAAPLTGWLVHRQMQTAHESELAAQQAAWEQERAAHAAALKAAKSRKATPVVTSVAPVNAAGPGAAEIITALRALQSGEGSPTRRGRAAIHHCERLIALGAAALPAIAEFFARDEDVNFDLSGNNRTKGFRADVTDEFLVPPSLRFALLDVVRQIGGAASEKLLAEILGTTGRGVELAWIARALQQSAPAKYRDIAVAGARELLERPLATGGSALDRNDRDHLFSVLAMYGDTGYVTTARTQLIQADGAIDRSVLKYLQQSLGPQSVPVAAAAWNDPKLTDPAKKEPLARLALNFAGADPQANDFYVTAINDMGLTKDQRSNLIEDLNEDGFSNPKNLSASDLPLIENRLALIEQLAPSAADEVNAAAFKEAHKDLMNMRDRLTQPPPAK